MLLSQLGPRICILGPSNSGKSTLAEAIGAKSALPVIHLDRLYHQPFSNWEPRLRAEFDALHAQAIAGERWVMDGNYSSLFPQRFERASGVVLLDVSTSVSILRYLRRTVIRGTRSGGLQGGRDSLKASMLHHIAVVTPGNRRRYAQLYEQLRLPKVCLRSMRAIDEQGRQWELDHARRPGG